MKHTRQNWRLYAIAVLCALCILWQNQSYAKAAGEDKILITQGDTVTEHDTEPFQIQFSGNSYECRISPVKLNDIWMVPVQEFFSEILDFYYRYSEDDGNILLKTPGRESIIVFTPNSNTALVNGTAENMPAQVLLGTNEETEESDYMIPLEFTLNAMGYTYNIQDVLTTENTVIHVIQIESAYLFYKNADDVTFDAEKYDNALNGISVMKNGTGKKNFVRGITQNPIPAENITITQNVKNSSVTLHFQKTYNPFGSFTEELNTTIVLKLEVWEEEETSCIRIYYQPNYIYTRKFLENGGMITFSKASFSIKALLPDDVSFSKITTTDQYWNKKFLILIPGNYVNFYKENPPVSNASNIKKINVAKTAEGNTKIVVVTKSLRGYKLTEGEGFFTVKIGAPEDIYDKIVLLDAGHGGKDAGASRAGLKEKKLNLTILYTYAKAFFESAASSVKAYWTRHNDTFINLYTRPTLTKTYQADLFVSLHMNSSSSSAANGTEVYYSKLNNSKADSGLTSKKFAKLMESTLIDRLNNKSRGVKQAGFVVIKNNTVPAILIELGFITGNSDATKLKKESYQKNAAKAIYEGIEETFEKYPVD